MIKKLLFLSLCLTLTFSPCAQTQQAQVSHDTLEQLAIKDLGNLTEVIKQLPEEEQALVKQVISEKKDGNELLGALGAIGFLTIFTILQVYGIRDLLKSGKSLEEAAVCCPAGP